jgi:hypothetical protein
MQMLWMVAFGDMNSGFTFQGPFESYQDAAGYAKRDGMVVELEPAERNGRVVSLEYIPQPTG